MSLSCQSSCLSVTASRAVIDFVVSSNYLFISTSVNAQTLGSRSCLDTCVGLRDLVPDPSTNVDRVQVLGSLYAPLLAKIRFHRSLLRRRETMRPIHRPCSSSSAGEMLVPVKHLHRSQPHHGLSLTLNTTLTFFFNPHQSYTKSRRRAS